MKTRDLFTKNTNKQIGTPNETFFMQNLNISAESICAFTFVFTVNI